MSAVTYISVASSPGLYPQRMRAGGGGGGGGGGGMEQGRGLVQYAPEVS